VRGSMDKAEVTISRYKSGTLGKAEFIDEMYKHHGRLFKYMDLIAFSGLGKIEITREDVLFHTKQGVILQCSLKDRRAIPLEILNFGSFEPGETKLLESLTPEDGVVADVGANIGWYSLHLARKAKRGEVLAFEPMPETAAHLRKNLERNNVRNVIVHEIALSDHTGEQTFYYQPESTGASSAVDILAGGSAMTVPVHVLRMDDVCANTERLDLIKCDVEGGELGMLRGAVETIRRTRPVLFLELLRKWSAKFNYHPNEAIELLSELGYLAHEVVADGRIRAISAVTEETVATNFVFFHTEKHDRMIEHHGIGVKQTPGRS
jgi:FkbM family methyltransferase